VNAELTPLPCPLCGRPNEHPSNHHLVPKSRGGRVTEAICRDCHRAIHATFSNKELAQTYNTVDALMAHEELARMIRFIGKQDGRVKIVRSKRRAKGRYR
jgi:hypothetical protein